MNETPLPLIVRATTTWGPVDHPAKRRERRAQLAERVPVARHRVPPEGPEPVLEPSDPRRFSSVGLSDCQLVAVDDDREARESRVGRRLQPLVVLGPPGARRRPA
jgi:hypothetical protein